MKGNTVMTWTELVRGLVVLALLMGGLGVICFMLGCFALTALGRAADWVKGRSRG